MSGEELPLWRQALVTLLLAAGMLISAVGVLGMVRVSDPYGRIHAAGKGVVLGVVSILAAGIFVGDAGLAVRSLATACLVLLTMPLASHVLARAQYESEGAGEAGRGSEGAGGNPEAAHGSDGTGGSREAGR